MMCFVVLGLAALADGRTWTDSTGNYTVEADLIGFNDATVVLKKKNRQLVAVPIDKLSKEDQTYLKSKEVGEQDATVGRCDADLDDGLGAQGRRPSCELRSERRHDPASPRQDLRQ